MDKALRADLFAIVVLGIFLLMAASPRQVYDAPTVMFFTLSLAFFQRRQLLAYELVFPLACLNRETTVLLVVLFAVYFFPRLDRRVYCVHLLCQAIVYGLVFVALRYWLFASAPGTAVEFRLQENLLMYVRSPMTTLLFLCGTVTLLVFVAYKWQRAPVLMRTAFLVFAPILAVMYLLIGQTFEVRVFMELVPVVAIIGVS